MKKSLKLVAGALFIFALLFNTSLINNDGAVSLSLTALQMAQAQDGEDDDPHDPSGNGDEYGGGYDDCGTYTCDPDDCYNYYVEVYSHTTYSQGNCPQHCTVEVDHYVTETRNTCD